MRCAGAILCAVRLQSTTVDPHRYKVQFYWGGGAQVMFDSSLSQYLLSEQHFIGLSIIHNHISPHPRHPGALAALKLNGPFIPLVVSFFCTWCLLVQSTSGCWDKSWLFFFYLCEHVSVNVCVCVACGLIWRQVFIWCCVQIGTMNRRSLLWPLGGISSQAMLSER